MTKQETFDRVWQHFITDRQPPGVNPNYVRGDIASGNRCLYLDPETGARCAVGLFLDDPAVALAANSHGSVGALVDYEEYRAALSGLSIALLVELQLAHDDASEEDDFHASMRDACFRVANAYGLTTPEPNPYHIVVDDDKETVS